MDMTTIATTATGASAGAAAATVSNIQYLHIERQLFHAAFPEQGAVVSHSAPTTAANTRTATSATFTSSLGALSPSLSRSLPMLLELEQKLERKHRNCLEQTADSDKNTSLREGGMLIDNSCASAADPQPTHRIQMVHKACDVTILVKCEEDHPHHQEEEVRDEDDADGTQRKGRRRFSIGESSTSSTSFGVSADNLGGVGRRKTPTERTVGVPRTKERCSSGSRDGRDDQTPILSAGRTKNIVVQVIIPAIAIGADASRVHLEVGNGKRLRCSSSSRHIRHDDHNKPLLGPAAAEDAEEEEGGGGEPVVWTTHPLSHAHCFTRRRCLEAEDEGGEDEKEEGSRSPQPPGQAEKQIRPNTRVPLAPLTMEQEEGGHTTTTAPQQCRGGVIPNREQEHEKENQAAGEWAADEHKGGHLQKQQLLLPHEEPSHCHTTNTKTPPPSQVGSTTPLHNTFGRRMMVCTFKIPLSTLLTAAATTTTDMQRQQYPLGDHKQPPLLLLLPSLFQLRLTICTMRSVVVSPMTSLGSIGLHRHQFEEGRRSSSSSSLSLSSSSLALAAGYYIREEYHPLVAHLLTSHLDLSSSSSSSGSGSGSAETSTMLMEQSSTVVGTSTASGKRMMGRRSILDVGCLWTHSDALSLLIASCDAQVVLPQERQQREQQQQESLTASSSSSPQKSLLPAGVYWKPHSPSLTAALTQKVCPSSSSTSTSASAAAVSTSPASSSSMSSLFTTSQLLGFLESHLLESYHHNCHHHRHHHNKDHHIDSQQSTHNNEPPFCARRTRNNDEAHNNEQHHHVIDEGSSRGNSPPHQPCRTFFIHFRQYHHAADDEEMQEEARSSSKKTTNNALFHVTMTTRVEDQDGDEEETPKDLRHHGGRGSDRKKGFLLPIALSSDDRNPKTRQHQNSADTNNGDDQGDTQHARDVVKLSDERCEFHHRLNIVLQQQRQQQHSEKSSQTAPVDVHTDVGKFRTTSTLSQLKHKKALQEAYDFLSVSSDYYHCVSSLKSHQWQPPAAAACIELVDTLEKLVTCKASLDIYNQLTICQQQQQQLKGRKKKKKRRDTNAGGAFNHHRKLQPSASAGGRTSSNRQGGEDQRSCAAATGRDASSLLKLQRILFRLETTASA